MTTRQERPRSLPPIPLPVGAQPPPGLAGLQVAQGTEGLFTAAELEMLWADARVCFDMGHIKAADLLLLLRYAALDFLHPQIEDYREQRRSKEAEFDVLLQELRAQARRNEALGGAAPPPQARAPVDETPPWSILVSSLEALAQRQQELEKAVVKLLKPVSTGPQQEARNTEGGYDGGGDSGDPAFRPEEE